MSNNSQSGTLNLDQTVLTDNVNGTLTIDNGITPQDSIRPITELTAITTAQYTPDDTLPIYDATTGNHLKVSISQILANSFDNDLGVGADGKVETGFPLHRDTTTTGAFYRHWNNNRTGVTTNSQGLIYGVNNFGLGSGYFDATNIGQGAATFGYLNKVNSTYSFATGQQNDLSVSAINSFATGYLNTVSNTYSQAFGYSNTNRGYISWVQGNTNQVQAGSYNAVTGGYNNIVTNGAYNLIGEGSSNTNSGGSYCSIQNGASNSITSTSSYNTVVNGSSNTITAGSYQTVSSGASNALSGNYGTVFGYSNTYSGYGGIIGGFYNTNSGSYCQTWGYNNNASGSMNSATGYLEVITGNYNAIGGGYNNNVAGTYNFAACYNNQLSTASFGNAVFGYSNIVTGERGIIGGNSQTYAGAYSAMFGNANTIAAGVYGTQTTGVSNQANGAWNSLLAGEGNIVNAGGLYTKIVLGYTNRIITNTHVVFAIGQSNTIGNAAGLLANNGAGAIGATNTVEGQTAIAIGISNQARAVNAISIGNSAVNTTTNGLLLGGAVNLIGFYGVTPVARQAGGGITTVAQVVTALRNLGLVS